jgi:hypothetical protein
MKEAIKNLDPETRYRDYLRSFGIVEPGDRIAELRDLDLGNVRFFAYGGGEGLRLKAAATPHGLVTPGGNVGDDWNGFLIAMPDGDAAAQRIAWIESDSSPSPHALAVALTIALTPDHPPSCGIDPAQWALVTAPVLAADPGRATLIAWLLPSGSRIPMRWTVDAKAGALAVIERVSAFDLIIASAGSVEAAAAAATTRARRLLSSGTDDERWWALQHIGENDDHAAIQDIAAILVGPGASVNIRILAAGTLARLADPEAVMPLGAALRADTTAEVRRACAQALCRIPSAGSLQALAEASWEEPDVIVRAEIVHALAMQGSKARDAMARIARDDTDAGVRDLARLSLESIQ